MALELRQTVLDTTDAKSLAEFYRQLLGWEYRPGGEEDQERPDWLVLVQPGGGQRLAFQLVDQLPASTWPTTTVPQQLHLDLLVRTTEELAVEHERVLGLGGRLLEDRSADETEPLYVYADPAGHPFCVFVEPR